LEKGGPINELAAQENFFQIGYYHVNETFARAILLNKEEDMSVSGG
jgi:hypothetical protein